jgi:hypothetical protein
VNIIVFIVSLAVFVAGFFVMGSAFTATGSEGLVFFAGLVCTALGLAIPVHVLKRIDG